MNKKLLILLIMTIPFLTIGASCSTQKINEQTSVGNKTSQAPDITKEYLSSKFRVLFVQKHPTEPYFFVVATDRAVQRDQGGLESNDTVCGSVYSQPTCYFFIDPDYNAKAPATKLVGTYEVNQGGGGMDLSSIKFTGPKTVEFQTKDGDAGGTIKAWWSINIDTGELKELKKTENTVTDYLSE